MKPGDIIKICFLPVGAVFETPEYGRGTLKSSTHKYGETPGRASSGWYAYPNFKYTIVWDGGVPWAPKSLSTRVTIVSLPQEPQLEDQPEEKGSAMERNIAALMREDAKTISVVFINREGGDLGKQYTYVTHLDFEPGDLAVVETTNGPAVVKVVCVHEDLAIEPGQNMKMKWVMDKVDTESYKANTQKNEEIEKFMATSYRANVRNSFKTMMLAQLDPESAAKLGNIIGDNPLQLEEVKPAKSKVKK